MRVVIADDAMITREGIARLLDEAGVEVAGQAEEASALLHRVAGERPDVAIVDIKMPPTHTDEGLLAAQQLRRSQPRVAVLVLSHYLESHWAMAARARRARPELHAAPAASVTSAAA